MSEGTPPESGPQRGFLRNFVDVYFSPGEAFADITQHPRFWLPFAAYLILALAFTAVWVGHVDPAQFMRNELELAGKWDQIPADRRGDVLAMQTRVFQFIPWVGALLGAPLSLVLVATVLLLIFRFVYGGDVRFGQALAVVSYSFLAMRLLSSPLNLLVMALKGEWNVRPDEAVQANPTLVLDHAAVARPLYAFLGSLDLFSFWTITLLAVGFATASRQSVGKAVWGVLLPWALLVGFKVAAAAF